MKKLLMVAMLLFASFFANVSALWAEEVKEEKVSTLIMLKNDFYFPSEGPRYELQKFQVYWHKDWLGGGFDVDFIRQKDFLRVKPYLTVNSGPWYLVGGASFQDVGGKTSQYARVGGIYIGKVGGWKVYSDMSNYVGLDRNSPTFSESLSEITYPLGKRFFIGGNVIFDHWWEGPAHNWILVGPLVGYKLTEHISPFVRIAHEWDFLGGKTREANSIRLGIVFSF